MPTGTEHGYWRSICKKYMQEQRADDWRYLLKIGRTDTFLNVVDQKFYEKEYSVPMEEYGVTEELKAKDPMAWIQCYNQVRAQIKERCSRTWKIFAQAMLIYSKRQESKLS
ncbi:TnpV protein [Selenomonas ruminantium]|uniref:Transposon-encoded protein TnpV n=1 Tax=Selenomonas ruminantium TaxID=971 RepID=A0A1K1LTY0_SELRU|nr:TnpV protein [Selenomonas ruminantium]SFW14389.1 Transposon-encoded protein TnpV [Selenomonas ruminantium]